MNAPTIIIPIFNERELIPILLKRIDSCLEAESLAVSVLLVDDGSSQPVALEVLRGGNFRQIKSLSVLQLGRNLGHQRALAVGLAAAVKNELSDAFVIMDGDGEDDPKYLPTLIQNFRADPERKTIFAKRVKRSEGIVFRISYSLFKLAHRLLTGHSISMGNFSIMSAASARRLTLMSELWNHFSGAYIKSKSPWVFIDTQRAERILGSSKMNFTSLVTHGINAISVHADTMGVRAIITTVVMMAFGLAGIAVLLLIRLCTDLAIPGWTSTLIFSILIIVLQTLIGALTLTFIVAAGRTSVVMTPAAHFEQFVLELKKVF